MEVHAPAAAAAAAAPSTAAAVRGDATPGVDGERAREDHNGAAAPAAAATALDNRDGARCRLMVLTGRRQMPRGRGIAAGTPVRAHLPAVEDD